MSISVLVRRKTGSWVKLQGAYQAHEETYGEECKVAFGASKRGGIYFICNLFTSPERLLAKQLSGYTEKSCLCICSNGFRRLLLAGDSLKRHAYALLFPLDMKPLCHIL